MNVRFLTILSLVTIFGSSHLLQAAQGKKVARTEEKKRGKQLLKKKSTSSSSSSSFSCPKGCQGPRGFHGPRGLPGECGCPFSFLSVYTQVSRTYESNDGLIFDQFAFPLQGSDLNYDSTTGTVTFNTSGFYEVSYGVQVDLVTYPPVNQNANFAALLSPGGVVPSSVLILSVGFSDLLNKISFIVEASAGQSMQIQNITDPACSNVTLANYGEASCINDNPVLAYLVVRKLS